MPSAYDRLPLGALRVFEAVATHLNFSVAADALSVTPAAVSLVNCYIEIQAKPEFQARRQTA